MTKSTIIKYLDTKYRTLGVIIFKPGYEADTIRNFMIFLKQNNLEVYVEKKIHLSKDAVIALYPKIFCFSNDDLKFGVKWKKQLIDYLISRNSLVFLIKGDKATNKLNKYKKELRKEYGRITDPKEKLSSKIFLEKVIKNLVHVVDQHEIQNSLWLLF